MNRYSNSPRPIRLAVALLLALSAAACSGGSADAASAVDIADSSFQPASLEVSAGEAVTWTNNDDVPHTVTFDDEGLESSGELEQGAEFTATFDTPGTYSYVCALHPDMSGSLTVTG